MPTPSDNAPQLSTTSIPDDISARATCPPEVERLSAWRDSSETSARAEHDAIDNAPSPVNATAHPVLMRSDDANSQATAADPMRVETGASGPSSMGAMAKPDEDSAAGRLSPPADPSSRSSRQPSSVTTSPSTASLLSYEFSNVRVCSTAKKKNCVFYVWPTDPGKLLPNYTSSFLRPGSRFTGTQQSDRQVYNVDVEIKHVDMAESYLCGYLRIQGLWIHFAWLREFDLTIVRS